MLNWMSEKAVAANAGRAGASVSCSNSVACDRRKAVAAPLLMAERRLSAALLRLSASMPGVTFQRAGMSDWSRISRTDQQNVVLASRVAHDPPLVKYSCAVSAVSPAGQDEVPDGSISVEEKPPR